MTPERLKVLNELAERVERLEGDLERGYDGRVTPATHAKINDLVEQDLKAQLAEARRQFEAA